MYYPTINPVALFGTLVLGSVLLLPFYGTILVVIMGAAFKSKAKVGRIGVLLGTVLAFVLLLPLFSHTVLKTGSNLIGVQDTGLAYLFILFALVPAAFAFLIFQVTGRLRDAGWPRWTGAVAAASAFILGPFFLLVSALTALLPVKSNELESA